MPPEPPPPTKKLLVCGSRDWTNHPIIAATLAFLHDRGFDTLIHGANGKLGPDSVPITGADLIADYYARQQGWAQVLPFKADWQHYGNAAGPIRNALMLQQHPTIVVALHDDSALGRGTADCVTRASRAGIPVFVLRSRVSVEDTIDYVERGLERTDHTPMVTTTLKDFLDGR